MRCYIVKKNGKLYYTYSLEKAERNKAKVLFVIGGLNISIDGIENLEEKSI